jgi:hypothetical protein
MKKRTYFHRGRLHRFLVLLIILSCTLFPSGCGNEGQGTFSVEPSRERIGQRHCISSPNDSVARRA